MDITQIDKNFKAAVVAGQDVEYYDVTEGPFTLEGLPWWEKGKAFYRLPYDFTKDDVNDGALGLSRHSTGVCVRFRTDSNLIALRAALSDSCDMNHMPRTGSAGFDIYLYKDGKYEFCSAFQPNRDQQILECLIWPFTASRKGTTPGMNEYCLNFPLYGGTTKVEIGLRPGSKLEAPHPHAIEAPVLFYGSSITQGGCASRPGNNYASMLCRDLDVEQVNLGFSGSGMGEPAVARAIASLKLSCFVMDYDHNAPNQAHLKATHEPFFKIIREAQPDLPIIIISKCNFRFQSDDATRRDIIRQTYLNAVAAGDKNVWFIDGETLFGTDNPDECTVDGCHPNDLGFFRMYKTILPVLKEALKK